MGLNLPERGGWIKAFGDLYLGLDRMGIIRRVLGSSTVMPHLAATPLEGLPWLDFTERYAAQGLREGLRFGWMAIAEQHVARDYWPSCLPFKPGVVTCWCAVDNDPVVSFAVRLSAATESALNTALGEPVQQSVDRLIRQGSHVYSGAGGPLTDLQVRELRDMLENAEYLDQLLSDLRAAVILPTCAVPLPYRLSTLFGLPEARSFGHRAATHQLEVLCDWSAEQVYCYRAVGEAMSGWVRHLVSGITAQSAIMLSDETDGRGDAVWVEITFHSQEPELRVDQRIEPLALSDPARTNPMPLIQRLITSAQAYLSPINGRAWAEPHPTETTTARLVLVLPRWRENA